MGSSAAWSFRSRVVVGYLLRSTLEKRVSPAVTIDGLRERNSLPELLCMVRRRTGECKLMNVWSAEAAPSDGAREQRLFFSSPLRQDRPAPSIQFKECDKSRGVVRLTPDRTPTALPVGCSRLPNKKRRTFHNRIQQRPAYRRIVAHASSILVRMRFSVAKCQQPCLVP
ncbi:uncharacterized protein [Zea mays]|uniref:uncharacterized protein isoform X1 n=1 Tax=Zea mays TaxID=4577 RepID=UPI0004DE9320|nr:uncharacterized protein LOC103643270 isoform X1 [Zea mays]|eukprot:XP_023157095.1 uncharacterized protein LOC103643270 isoform X1 [Zea mays]